MSQTVNHEHVAAIFLPEQEVLGLDLEFVYSDPGLRIVLAKEAQDSIHGAVCFRRSKMRVQSAIARGGNKVSAAYRYGHSRIPERDLSSVLMKLSRISPMRFVKQIKVSASACAVRERYCG